MFLCMEKMGRILTGTASGTLMHLALTFKTLQTDRNSKVATDIPELQNGQTFHRCRIDGWLKDIPGLRDWGTLQSRQTDGHSWVAGQMDILELRDRLTFHICRTDGHSRVAGPMDLPELKDLWIFHSCVFSNHVSTAFSPSNTATLMRQRFCLINDAIV